MPEKTQDFLKTAIILALASVFAYYAKSVGEASDVISVTYVLVVVLISRMTMVICGGSWPPFLAFCLRISFLPRRILNSISP